MFWKHRDHLKISTASQFLHAQILHAKLLAAPPFGKGVGCEALSITWNSQWHILRHDFNSQSMRSRSKVRQQKRYLSTSSSTPPPCLQALHLLHTCPQKKVMSIWIPPGLRQLPDHQNIGTKFPHQCLDSSGIKG